MSKVTIQKHLACHDYHMGHCALLKEKCPYSHVGKSWGICPNKSYCTTPHKLVDCPLFSQNCCPNGNDCSYRHQTKEMKPQEDELKINDEESKSDLSNGEERKIKNTIVKGLVIEDFKESLLELNQDMKILQPLIENQKKNVEEKYNSCSLDLCFIIDITGSMGSWINQTISYVKNTLNTIFQDFPAMSLRVAFSGYRDFCDPEETRYVCYDFSRNVADFSQKMSSIRCSGGGDTPEDVAGGLYNALKFDWSSIARQVIFIADAPCHGLKYHNLTDDTYPHGDPSGRNIEQLINEFKMKRIEFTIVEVSHITEKMFCIMKAQYGQIVVKKLSSGGEKNGLGKKSDAKLDDAVHASVMTTVTTSFSKSGLNGQEDVRPANGKLGAAYKMIMENKRFKGSKTRSQTRDKANFENKAVNLQETKVEEEEEFDSDDSDYEEKLEASSKKFQLKMAQIKEEQAKFKEEERLKDLRSQFPAHYFETIEEATIRSSKKKYREKLQKVRYMQENVNWDKFEDYNEYQAVCCSFELKRNAKNGKEVNWRNLETRTYFMGTRVRLSNLVFSEGAMRYAYHAKDLYLKQKMVAKQYKSSEKRKKNKIEEMKRDILSQIVCKHIVKEFNSRLLESSSETPLILQFIDCYIYEMTFPFVTDKLFYMEKFIDGKYEKFNNNAGYVSDTNNIYSQFAQTLSHFSWQLTKGYLAIVDLQGNDSGILTDPQIHCLDQHKFGDGNLGYEGILRFFATHECNSYCQALHLIHPKDTYEIPPQNPFFRDLSLFNMSDPEMMISQFCDICQHLCSFSVQNSLTSKQNHSRLVCVPCKQLIAKSTLEKKCHSCNDTITFSTYECIQLRRDAPPFCDPCQDKN